MTRFVNRVTLPAGSCDNWGRDEEQEVCQYLWACLRGASVALVCTAGLALSLYLPQVVFPEVDADFAA